MSVEPAQAPESAKQQATRAELLRVALEARRKGVAPISQGQAETAVQALIEGPLRHWWVGLR